MMNRKLLALLLALAMVLCACGGPEHTDSPDTPDGPGRMVRSIQVAIHPADPDFDRTYVTQENMNALLNLLRSMQTDEEPEQVPDPSNGQNLYTVTVTFANGEQNVYDLLGHTYLRLGDEDWCVMDTEKSMQFTEFIRSHPSDDGSVSIETTAPSEETTAPTE